MQYDRESESEWSTDSSLPIGPLGVLINLVLGFIYAPIYTIPLVLAPCRKVPLEARYSTGRKRH